MSERAGNEAGDLVERLRAFPENVLEGAGLCEEAAAEIERLRADIQAYRGALGYPVPGEFGEHLSDGTLPNNGIAEALHIEIDRLRAALAAAERERDALRELLREAQSYVVDVSDHPGAGRVYKLAAKDCWNRIDAALERQP